MSRRKHTEEEARAFDAVLFDIDNVLIDTRQSYIDAVRWTIEIYLTGGSVPFFRLNGKHNYPTILSRDDVEHFKILGGFNDDWDCCYGLLCYLLSLNIPLHTVTSLKKVMNVEKFVNSVKKRPLRVSGIVKRLGRPTGVMIEKISRIFQEVYLGREVFRLMERKKPMYWTKRGVIHKEKAIFRKSTFEQLARLGVKMGVATGRPRFEAIYALKEFGLIDYFTSVITMDEVKKAERQFKTSLRKPHPFSVVEAAKKIGPRKRFLYIGDLPDDILAANEAKKDVNIKSVGFPCLSTNPARSEKEFKKAKADYILAKATLLPDLVKRGRV